VEIASLLERVRTLMIESLAAQRISLTVLFPKEALHVRIDARQIEQVLINLIRNAQEALGENTNAAIVLQGLRGENGRVLIQVTDNGPGIDPTHMENIFVPFFTTKRSGTGVGLSISRQLVFANRGFVAVKSGAGGTTFTLQFPEAAE
jgi:two-component system, NtrC family, nitrogen regulation sensor histidine kinase NtrY